jgi:hypothetical protein
LADVGEHSQLGQADARCVAAKAELAAVAAAAAVVVV